MERDKKEKEALDIYDKVHMYSIEFEESIFRRDYFLKYLGLAIQEKDYLRCIEILTKEIQYLREIDRDNIESANLYILDLTLVYMITHNTKEIKSIEELLSSNEFIGSKEREIFSNLLELYEEGNQEEWESYLKSSDMFSIMPNNVF